MQEQEIDEELTDDGNVGISSHKKYFKFRKQRPDNSKSGIF